MRDWQSFKMAQCGVAEICRSEMMKDWQLFKMEQCGAAGKCRSKMMRDWQSFRFIRAHYNKNIHNNSVCKKKEQGVKEMGIQMGGRYGI